MAIKGQAYPSVGKTDTDFQKPPLQKSGGFFVALQLKHAIIAPSLLRRRARPFYEIIKEVTPQQTSIAISIILNELYQCQGNVRRNYPVRLSFSFSQIRQPRNAAGAILSHPPFFSFFSQAPRQGAIPLGAAFLI